MRVLFTGASSFTGFWFIRELTNAGHQVVALFREKREAYSGIRKSRLEALLPSVEPRFGTTLEAVRGESFDLVALHGAEVENYRSDDFDPLLALEKNTGLVRPFLLSNCCKRVVITSTVAEGISPYGLSKKWSAEWVYYMAKKMNISYGKFVIPNPFGPFEDEKFTTYLVTEWKAGKTPHVKTPHYVRDNIPVTRLAKSYLQFAFSDQEILLPSGYVSTQGEFVKRFAQEIGSRLSISCPYTMAENHDYPEPAVLVNSDALTDPWDENGFWDLLSDYYRSL